MITYPYDYYFSEDSVQTDIVITDGTASYSGTSLVVTGNTVLFTNENIDSEKMSLLETLCSDNTLHWGRCEASEFKFTIHSSVVPLEGTVLNVYLYFNNDASTLFKIGTYKVDSDVATALRTVREITCYDALLDVLNTDYIDWYNALDFDTVNTIKKFRDAFFTHVGITQKTVSLINDSVAVSKLSTESLTGSQILNAICEINGRFGHIDRDGKFAYIKLEQNIQGLYPAVDLYPSPTLYPQKPKSTPIASGSYIPPLKYEKYNVPSITRLQIRTDDSDIGVVVGTVGTDYVIQGNFLTFNLTGVVLTGIANNILGEISGVIFQPFEVQMRANLCFEVGDAIRCNDDLTGVEGYILYRNAVGIQAIIDTLNCMKERDYKLDANSVGYQFNAVNNKTAQITTSIDGINIELTEKVNSDDLVDTLNSKFTTVNISTDGFEFLSSGSIVIDTTNFQLDEDGNAAFSGSVTGSTITSSSFTSAGQRDTISISNGGMSITDGVTGEIAFLTSSGLEGQGGTAFTIQSQGELHIDSTSTNSVFLHTGSGDIKLRCNDTQNPTVTLNFLKDAVLQCKTGNTKYRFTVEADFEVHADSFSYIRFEQASGSPQGITLATILTNISSAQSAAASAIQWGRASGIEDTGSGLALNPPDYSGYVHIGYQANAITIGSSSISSINIMGETCSFKSVTINGTTYHLLGYTS